MENLDFIYNAFEAIVAMVTKIVEFFTSSVNDLQDTPLPDWIDNLNAPLYWIIETLGWGDITMLELMFVVGLPLFMVVAFVKFFLPTS